LGDLLGLSKDFLGHAFERWSTVLAVEFDTEILIRASWVVGSGEDDTTEAVSGTVVFVKLSNHSGNSWSGEEAVLADVDLPHTI
jgi:hypothetical protein